MQLAFDVTDYTNVAQVGLVEYAANLLNDRKLAQWSKPELVSWLNAEQRKLATLMTRWNRHYFAVNQTTPVVANQAYYSFPSDLLSLVDMEVVDTTQDIDGQPLTMVRVDEREFYSHLEAANRKQAHGYYFVHGTTFRLMPQGSSGFVRIYYIKRLADLINNGDISQIPEEHHETLSLGACLRALAKKRQRNQEIGALYTDALATLEEGIKQRYEQRNQTLRGQPWYGSFGPGGDTPFQLDPDVL